MNVDWFTVIAQALNFIVLLWLMKRFLYKPILHAIDERERRIAEELANAQTGQEAAKKQKDEYDKKNQELDRQRAAYLNNAKDDAHVEKLRLLEEAREEAEALRDKRKEALIEDEKASRRDVRSRIQDEVLAISRKVLTDLAGSSLEERVVGVFNQRLRQMDEAEIKVLTSALKTKPGSVSVRTMFDITPDLRSATEASITEILGAGTQVRFETAPELICGIELTVNGQKIAWSVADYLDSVQEGFDDPLKEKG